MADQSKNTDANPKLNRVESILGFMEWLYQQPECVRYMAMHNCEFATDLVKIFTDAQEFDELPRDDYPNNIVWPNVSFNQADFSQLASHDVVARIIDLVRSPVDQAEQEIQDQMAQPSPSERWN